MRQVKPIRRKNRAVLIEWMEEGKPRRGTIPADALKDGNFVDEETLAMAIPAGFPWAELIELSVTPQVIEDNLYNVGIWTLQDLLEKPNAALGAIQKGYKLDLATLTQKARQFQKEHEGG